jgi:hypothetical protein
MFQQAWRIHRPRKGPTYRTGTTEIFRADYQVLQHMSLQWFQHLQRWQQNVRVQHTRHWVEDRMKPYVNQPSKNGTYIEMLPSELVWLQKLDWSRLLKDNVQPSIHPCDHALSTRLVELGWNHKHEVCKAAYVTKVPQLTPLTVLTTTGTTSSSDESRQKPVGSLLDCHGPHAAAQFTTPTPATDDRYLFFCLGMDGGLKTAYITPGFKHRNNYSGRAPYKSLAALTQLL